MPWTCYKPDTQPLDIVEWITERVDLQLAAVTGPSVNSPNTERPSEDFENARLQRLGNTQCVIT
jgi:hypothetical protein